MKTDSSKFFPIAILLERFFFVFESFLKNILVFNLFKGICFYYWIKNIYRLKLYLLLFLISHMRFF